MNATIRTVSFLCAAAAAGAAFTLCWRGVGPARAERAGSGTCAQWQTTIAASVEVHRLEKVPEPGAVLPVNAPAGGWEPFGVGPNGVVYYRRCAP